MTKGQNVSLPTKRVSVTSAWGERGQGTGDLSCLLLSGGKVRGEADFVFYNQPFSRDREVALGQAVSSVSGASQDVALDLGRLPAEVDSVVVVISFDGPPGSTLAAIQPISVASRDESGATAYRFVLDDLLSETAAVLFEYYRRDNGWKLRAVGQGYFDGLAGLARDFGVVVDDEPPVDAAAPPETSPPLPVYPPPPVPQSPVVPPPDYSEPLSSPAPTPVAPGIDWRNPPVPRGY